MRQFAASTHTGLQRKQNEDCYEADPDLGLWLVADGVGGHSCGEVASEIVRTTLKDCIARGETLSRAVEKSHSAILAAIRKSEAARGMGSTVVALLIDGDKYELCWVGDSRAYLWNSRLHQITRDHNRASELLANDEITPQQAVSHPQRHVLTQSLGVSEEMELSPGRVSGTLGDRQQILLCSDGLSDELPDSEIGRIMAGHHDVQGRVDALVNAALEAGGNDNITAVVIGGCNDRPAAADSNSLQDSYRIEGADNTDTARFPIKAWLLVSAMTLLVLWLLLKLT